MTRIARWPRKHLLYNKWEQHLEMNENPITYYRPSQRAILLRILSLLCNRAVVEWSVNVIFNEKLLIQFVTAWIKAIAYLSNFWKVRPSLIIGFMKSLMNYTNRDHSVKVWMSYICSLCTACILNMDYWLCMPQLNLFAANDLMFVKQKREKKTQRPKWLNKESAGVGVPAEAKVRSKYYLSGH